MTDYAFYRQCLAICARGFANEHAAGAWFAVRRKRIYSLSVARAAEIIFVFRQTSLKGSRMSQRGAPSKDL